MKFQLSNIAIVIVILSCFAIDLSLKNWEKQDRVIEWDVHWYYGYLPAAFIYNDITISKSDYKFGDHYYLIWPVFTEDGKKVIKTTMGLAMLYAPFFFVAHTYALLSDYPPNGFSEPYKVFLLLSAIFYLLIGLDFLKKTLRHFKFRDATIAITILLIGLGTNLLCYASQSAPMSHVYNFCLFSIFIYYTIKWYELPNIKNTLIIGFVIGLIALIRPSNLVLALFFILYGISNISDFKYRFLFFKKKFPLLLLMALPFLLVWIPQFIYWKIATGHFICYSYGDERFFFNRPQIINGLFSFRKGWLTYTPMMSFALIGIFFLKDNLKKIQFGIILFLTVNIYVIFSWWCWWYGGTYGQRSMIESYALLAIPLASFIKTVSEKKWYVNALFYSIAIFFIWLNIFQTYQFENFSLHWEAMSKELYFKQFGKLDKIKDYDKYLSFPDYEDAKTGGHQINIDKNGLKSSVALSMKVESEKPVNLKAANGKYVCADKTINNLVIANRDNAYQWETFTLVMFENNKCALRTYENKFFSAEIKHENEIIATRTTVADWETFTLVNIDKDIVAFKAANGKYLSMDEKTMKLFATADTIGMNEKFILIWK